MIAAGAWSLAAAILLTAAALKASDRTAATVALGGYGVPGRLAGLAWAALIAAEAGLAAALAGGVAWAPAAATALLGAFAVAQAVALARGGGGAPCGCFGGRGRLGPGSLARTALLAGLCALLPLLGGGPGLPLGLGAALAAACVVLALGRRAPGPAGALELDGEGPPLGASSPVEVPGTGFRLALFVSPSCRLCRRVRRAADLLAAHGVPVRAFDEQADAAAWAAAGVPGAPFAVALAPDGAVLAKGTVNDGAQLESVLATAEARWLAADEARAAGTDQPARAAAADETRGSSRRGFLVRAGGAAAALTGAGAAGALVRPGEAQAYHFCGHIYTTDSCPHPTGLPRVDRRGFPLRARDGVPVDDLGRPVDRQGRPLGEDDEPLTDFDGRPLPVASRSRVCSATARQYGITARVDGAWYRCCGGRVRKLVDCCSPSDRRINGDGSLKGYCYKDRKVFCVMYFQTTIPC